MLPWHSKTPEHTQAGYSLVLRSPPGYLEQTDCQHDTDQDGTKVQLPPPTEASNLRVHLVLQL